MPAPEQRVAGDTAQKPSFVKHSIASQRLHQAPSPAPSGASSQGNSPPHMDRSGVDRMWGGDAAGRSRSPPEQRRLGMSALEGIAEVGNDSRYRLLTPRATTATYRAPSTTLGRERPDFPAVRAAAMRSAMDAASGVGRGAGGDETLTRTASEELNEEDVAEMQRRQREQQMALLQASSIEPGWTRRGQPRGRFVI